MRTPPLLADFSHARACKPFCEKYLTLPRAGRRHFPGPGSGVWDGWVLHPPCTVSTPPGAPSSAHIPALWENGRSRPRDRPHTKRQRGPHHWLKEWEKGQLGIQSCPGTGRAPAFWRPPAYGTTERVGRLVHAPLFQEKGLDLPGRRAPRPLCQAQKVGALGGA